MSELRRIQMLVFLILMLQFTVNQQLSSFVAVRAGDDVTLTCEHVKDEQDECQNIEWFYNDADHTRIDGLVRNGQIEASRSNRLRLGEKCSLVIKNVTDQDVGRYICRRGGDSVVYLSVVTLTGVELENKTHFYCYVSTHKYCEPSVKWLNQDKVFIGHRDLKASQNHYYAVLSIEDSQFNSPMLNSLTCEVTDCTRNVHQFLLSSQTSDKDTKPAPTESSTTVRSVRVSSTTSEDTKPTTSTTKEEGWWRIIIVSVGLTTLIITVVTVDIWIRTKGNKTQKNQTTVGEGNDTVKYENAGVSSASV